VVGAVCDAGRAGRSHSAPLSAPAGNAGFGGGAGYACRPLERIRLAAAFRALPVKDLNDGETVLCFRSYLPAALRVLKSAYIPPVANQLRWMGNRGFRSRRHREIAMISKSKGWILIGVLLAAALTATGVAQVATTQVADTIYHADGTAATGTAIVSWPAFTTGAGDAIPAAASPRPLRRACAERAAGPQRGRHADGSYYTVVYHLDDGTVSRQYWVVPASAAAVRVSAVESTVLPASVAMQTVSKSYVDTAIAAAVAGHPLDSTPYVLKAGTP